MSYEPPDDPKDPTDPPLPPAVAGDVSRALLGLCSVLRAAVDQLATFAQELEDQSRRGQKPAG